MCPNIVIWPAWKPVCLTSIRLPLLILSLTDFFMKLFKTNNIEIVKTCQEFFGIQLPSVQIAKRTIKFEIQIQERSRLIKLLQIATLAIL